jgi:hypothetical protein
VLASACDDARRVPIADAGGGIRPFSELHGVALGMTTEELRLARPLARPAPASGLKEFLGDRGIDYTIAGTPEHGPPGAQQRLQEVIVTQASVSDSATMSAWREAMANVTTHLGEPGRCLRYDNSIVTGYEAQWRIGAIHFLLAVYLNPRSSGLESSSGPPGAVIASMRRPEERHWWYALLFSTDSTHSPRRALPCSALVHISHG